MQVIEYLMEHIDEELHDAHGYAEKALSCKDRNPSLSDALHHMAQQELQHAGTLQAHLKSAISRHESEHGALPEMNVALLDWERHKAIEKETAVRKILDMYK